MSEDRVYDVKAPATIGGYVKKPGDTIAHSTIMRRAPWQLGSLLRLRIIEEVGGTSAGGADAGAPDFDTMTGKGIRTWADKNGIDLADAPTKVAALRDWIKKETA